MTSSPVNEILKHIVDNDLLEDRCEYDNEELQYAYPDLTPPQINELYVAIRTTAGVTVSYQIMINETQREIISAALKRQNNHVMTEESKILQTMFDELPSQDNYNNNGNKMLHGFCL